MKRFLLILVACLAMVSTSAEQLWYQTTGFKKAAVYDGMYSWPQQWEASNIKVCIDTDDDVITIYSPKIQVYAIYGMYNNGQAYKDGGGGQTVKFYAFDQDYDKCEIRLRIETNGNSQIYIDFSNIAWVYNVKRIR